MKDSIIPLISFSFILSIFFWSEDLTIKVINSKHNLTDYKVFNAGSDKNNFNKRKIAEKIKKYLGGKIKLTNASFDKRNYIVDFSKVENILGFKAKYSVDFGIKEIIKNINKNKKKFNQLKKLGNFVLYYGKKKNWFIPTKN